MRLPVTSQTRVMFLSQDDECGTKAVGPSGRPQWLAASRAPILVSRRELSNEALRLFVETVPVIRPCGACELPWAPSLAVPPPTWHLVTSSCQVTDAASDEVAFTLTYSVNGAVCRGSLVNGAGSCTAAFTLTSSSISLGTVSRVLLPDHDPLGPVAPFPLP
jgi:hypothetical protein